MDRKIYEAMKARLNPATKEQEEWYRSIYPETPAGITIWRFDADGINNEGYDDDQIEPIVHGMKTKNMWNIASRFWSFISWHKDAEKRLLSIV